LIATIGFAVMANEAKPSGVSQTPPPDRFVSPLLAMTVAIRR
jgi:hypothetical protein